MPTLVVAAASTTDMSAASAIFPGVVNATMNIEPESTPAPTMSKAGALPKHLLATAVQHNTHSLTKTVETATMLAAATGHRKQMLEEPQLDGRFNEKCTRRLTTKMTTGPPNSANGWNKSSFSSPDDPTPVLLSMEEAKRKEST